MKFVFNRLIGARKAKGLNQEDLANKTGVSLRTVANWETGVFAPQGKNIRTLCEVLDISTEYLFKYEEEELRDREGGDAQYWRARALEAERVLREICNDLLTVHDRYAAPRKDAPESQSLPAETGPHRIIDKPPFNSGVERAIEKLKGVAAEKAGIWGPEQPPSSAIGEPSVDKSAPSGGRRRPSSGQPAPASRPPK